MSNLKKLLYTLVLTFLLAGVTSTVVASDSAGAETTPSASTMTDGPDDVVKGGDDDKDEDEDEDTDW